MSTFFTSVKHLSSNGTGTKFLASREAFDCVCPVEFDINGGISASYYLKSYQLFLTYGELPTAVHETSAFGGWYSESERKILASDLVDYNIKKMTAKWLNKKYTKLEYILGNSAILDTLYYPTLTTKLKFEIAFTDYTGSVLIGHSGTDGTDNDDFRFFNAGSHFSFYWDYGNRRLLNQIYLYSTTDLLTIECWNGGYKVNSTTYSGTTTSYNVSHNTIGIFGDNRSDTVGCNVRISYLLIYESNTLKMDLIAAKDFDDIPGMYDKISQKFFYSINQYTPIAGPEKA